MAELSIPYVRRQIARRSLAGGGGVPGVVSQPRVPDVSGMYQGMAGLGEDITQIGENLGQVAAAHQRARDTATLTSIESQMDEQVAAKSQEILRDASIHPFDYRQTLQTYRDSLLGSLEIPDRLRAMATAKVQKSTQGYLIALDAEGTKRGVQQAENVYDYYMEQQSRKWLNATDPNERDQIGESMRAKTREYIESGIFSPDQAAIKLRDRRDKTQYDALEMYAIDQPKAFLTQAKQGLLNDLPGDLRVKLMDKAQTERKEQAAWQDSEDRRAEKALAEQQSVRSSQIRDQIYKMGGGPGAIKLVSDARAINAIGEQDHASLLSFAIRLQTERESQAASRAARADIAQRRADENRIGLLTAQMISGTPGPDGQLVTPGQVMDLAASGKLNGRVAGEVAMRVSGMQERMQSAENAERKQTFQEVLQQSEAIFDQHGLSPSRVAAVEQAWAAYRERLGSMVWRDNMDPFEARDKIINQYIGTATGALNKRVGIITNSLPQAYRPTPETGVAPALTQLQSDFLSGFVTEGDYRTMARQLRELDEYPMFKQAKSASSTNQQKGIPGGLPAGGEPSNTESAKPTAPADIEGMRQLGTKIRDLFKLNTEEAR